MISIGRLKHALGYLKLYYYGYSNGKFEHYGKNTIIVKPFLCTNPSKVYIGNDVIINCGCIILNQTARVIFKDHVIVSNNFLISTGNHVSKLGMWQNDTSMHIPQTDKDVIIENDVWIGANVTLLTGVHIGRGCIIGAGAVCRSDIPPYSVVMGNPAKIIRFKFTPNEILEHEKILYSEEERIPIELLNENYNKYYLSRITDIKKYKSI